MVNIKNRGWARCLAGGLLALLAAAPAGAAEVKFGGLVYGQYGMYTSKRASSGAAVRGKGEFDITRIYLIGEGKFSPTVKAKLILEGNGTGTPSADSHKANAVFLKNAFISWTPLEPLSVSLGMIVMPWIVFEEGIWGRRFVQKTYMDQQGLIVPVDKGLGVLYMIPKGYGEVHAAYVNGEGYNVQETVSGDGRYKDLALRVSIAPLPEDELLKGIKLHMYVQNGQQGSGDAKRRDRYLGGISYQGSQGHLMYTASQSNQGNNTAVTSAASAGSNNRRTFGQSLHGSLKVCEAASVFGRYDYFSTEAATLGGLGATSADTDAFRRGILGVDYKLADGVTVSLNDQWLTPITKRWVSGAPKTNENQILLQFEAKF